MRLRSLLWRSALGLLLGLLLLGGLAYWSDPWFWGRYATSMKSLDPAAVDWRQPQVPVPGGARPLPTAEPAQIAAPALRAAIDYAEAMDSFALLVFHGGALVHEQYWQGHGPHSRFDSNSLHKGVLAMVLGLAIEDGHIDSLDDPVGRYLEEWADDARAAITLRELGTMHSGLRVEAFRLSPLSKGMRLVMGSNVEELTLALPLEDTPGADFQYLNFNAQALGIAVSRAVGQPYARYLSERLWQPLGAPDAAVWLDRAGGTPRLFCCLLTTARAWIQLGRLLLDDGRIDGERILPGGWVAEMMRPSASNPNFGLHLWLGSPPDGVRPYNRESGLEATHSEPYLAADVVYLDGAGGQRLYVVPSAGLIILRIGKPRLDWDDAVLPNALLRGIRAADGNPRG